MNLSHLGLAGWNGLVLGSLIGLIAVGYSIVYGVSRLINFAHGDIFAFSAYFVLFLAVQPPAGTRGSFCVIVVCILGAAAYIVFNSPLTKRRKVVSTAVIGLLLGAVIKISNVGSPIYVALGLAVLLTLALALAVQEFAYRPLLHGPRLNLLISSIGVSFILQSCMQVFFGTARTRFPDQVTSALVLRDVYIPGISNSVTTRIDLLIIATGLVAALAIWFVTRETKIGLILRAVADNPELARRYGVSEMAAIRWAFALGATLACIASTLFVMRESSLDPAVGYQQGLLAFAAAVLGGIGRIGGAWVGGLVIGMVLSFTPLLPLDFLAEYFPSWIAIWLPSLKASDWGFGFVYLAMTLTLLFRPRGIVGELQHRTV